MSGMVLWHITWLSDSVAALRCCSVAVRRRRQPAAGAGVPVGGPRNPHLFNDICTQNEVGIHVSIPATCVPEARGNA